MSFNTDEEFEELVDNRLKKIVDRIGDDAEKADDPEGAYADLLDTVDLINQRLLNQNMSLQSTNTKTNSGASSNTSGGQSSSSTSGQGSRLSAKLTKWAGKLQSVVNTVAVAMGAPRHSISVSLAGISIGLTWDTYPPPASRRAGGFSGKI